MNFLIAGLGNIGEEYLETRHNVGFKVLDLIAAQNKTTFSVDRLAFTAQYKFKGKNIYLIKPTTYMNLSGKAVKYWMNELKIPTSQLLVVVDELALPFGTIRIKTKGSDGGHNGLKDIQNMLMTQEYPRLRFGIGNQFAKGKQVDYVLGRWSPEEIKNLEDRLIFATQAVDSFLFEGVTNAMTKYNK